MAVGRIVTSTGIIITTALERSFALSSSLSLLHPSFQRVSRWRGRGSAVGDHRPLSFLAFSLFYDVIKGHSSGPFWECRRKPRKRSPFVDSMYWFPCLFASIRFKKTDFVWQTSLLTILKERDIRQRIHQVHTMEFCTSLCRVLQLLSLYYYLCTYLPRHSWPSPVNRNSIGSWKNTKRFIVRKIFDLDTKNLYQNSGLGRNGWHHSIRCVLERRNQ
jgi:hypothetical protein